MIPAGAEAGKSTKNAIWNQTKKNVLNSGRVHAGPAPEAPLEGEFHLPHDLLSGSDDLVQAFDDLSDIFWSRPTEALADSLHG